MIHRFINHLMIASLYFFLLGILCSCKKDKDPGTETSTSLKFTVTSVYYCSGANGVVSNAYISVYSSQTDANYNQNSIATGKTDQNGNFVVSNLKSQIYYFKVEKPCGGSILYNCNVKVTNGALVGNITNEIIVPICKSN